MVLEDRPSSCNAVQGAEMRSYQIYLAKKPENGKSNAVFMPKEEWEARGRAGVCRVCGQKGHVQKECRIEKTAKCLRVSETSQSSCSCIPFAYGPSGHTVGRPRLFPMLPIQGFACTVYVCQNVLQDIPPDYLVLTHKEGEQDRKVFADITSHSQH